MKEMEIREPGKEVISKWCSAVEHHNIGAYKDAVEAYCGIEDLSARMNYNLACAHIKLGNMEDAIRCLTSAIQIDNHLAVACFQRGTLYLQCKSIEKAVTDLETARVLLRGNTFIDYKPLGLYARLTSCQVLFNLALALAYDQRFTDATNLLDEARHDADDIQRKTLDRAQQAINDNRLDLIQEMTVSIDKVFTPPRHVTKNLEKKDIVRKAKVVSSSNTEDRNPTFEGSKRVRQLKDLPTLPLKSPLLAVRRYVQNMSTNSFDHDDGNKNSGMKKSKSMSDLSEIRNKGFTPKSPMVKLRHLFQKKSPSGSEIQDETKQKRQSFDEIMTSLKPNFSGTGKTSPIMRSPNTGVRKLLRNKRKGRTSDPLPNEEMPVIRMRGSTGDIWRHGPSSSSIDSDADSSGSERLSRSSSDLYEKLNVQNKGERNSLGSVFGDYRTITGFGLSLSCDVLTAIATPTESGNDDTLFDDAFISADNGTGLELSKTESTHSYVNTREENNNVTNALDLDTRVKVLPLRDEQYTPDLNKCVQYPPTSDKNSILDQKYLSSQIQTNECVKPVTESTLQSSSDTSATGQGDVMLSKKPRPPPPSYPPPPLPPKIVIQL